MANTVIVADLGTSAVKCYLFDADSGAVLGSSRREVELQVPEAGAAETDPAGWWDGLCSTIGELLQNHDRSLVRAVTLTNQQISCVFLDERGEPVAPAILWMDTRCTEEISFLRQRCESDGRGMDWLMETTGIPPSDSWGLMKLLWFKHKFPEAFGKIRQVASVDAYIFQRLCGRFVTDETNACFFHLDIRSRQTAKEMLSYLGIDKGLFPEVVPPGTVIGSVDRAAARRTGLPEGLPVVAAASDQPCAVLGMGVSRPGEAVVNLGTGAFFLTPLNAPLVDRRMMTNISAVSSQWLMMGTHYLSGGALSWLRNLFLVEGSSVTFPDLDDYAERVEPGADGLVFLPGLSGTGTPNWDPDARGMFANLSLSHSVGHLARAVMESTGYGIRSILDTYEAIGVPLERLVIAGGPTVSTVWRQAVADILQRPLELSLAREATPLGAAMLAATACGIVAGLEETVGKWAETGTVIWPRSEHKAVYDRSYERYLAWLAAEASVRRDTNVR